MSAATTTQPPAVDEGDSPGVAATVIAALAPSWARLHSTLLVLAPMLVVLGIWETFRLPEPAIATFIMLMIARGDALSTIGSSISVAATVSLGALIAIAVLAASLSQPALRVPLMALMTFTTMMLVRGTTLGPPAFITGFFATYGTTQADDLLGLAGSPDTVTNTEGFGRPAIDFFPPEEALLHSLLWLGLVAALPALLLAVTERLAGADPQRLLRGKFRERTEAAAAFCRGEAGASDRLRAVAREGIAPLLDLMDVAERAGGTEALHDVHLRLTRGFNRLLLLLVAWDMGRPDQAGAAEGAAEAAFLRPVGQFAGALGERLRERAARTRPPPPLPLPPMPPEDAEATLEGPLPSLAAEIRVVLEDLRAAEADRVRDPQARRAAGPPFRKPLLQPNAFGAANVQFALKVTLSVMTAYLVESGLDWQGISTCVVTCFFVALATIGETVHKMTLRITGCLIGAALGIGSILLLMPSMTGFAQLAILFAPVAFAGAWIGFGSPRIAYAGWQILLAFGLTTLQGYGPTLDMQTARDRVVGILVGNLITTLVFLFVWPVRVGDAVRRDMAGAFDILAQLIALEGTVDGPDGPDGRRAREGRLRDQFTAAIARVGAVIPNDRFEPDHAGRAAAAAPGTGRLGRGALAKLGRLVVPVSVIATDGVEPTQRDAIPQSLRDEIRAFHAAMRDWFGEAADWVRTGAHRDRLRATLPLPPLPGDLPDTLPASLVRRVRGRAALYALLSRQIDDFLGDALPAGAGPAGALAGPDLVAGRRELAAG